MLVYIATDIGSVMPSRHTNNSNAVQFHATTVSDLIVHVILVLGYVILVMADMSLRGSKVVIESVKSVSLVIVQVEV